MAIPDSQFLTFAIVAAAAAVWVSVGVAWAVESRLFVRPLKKWKSQRRFRKLAMIAFLVGAVAFAGVKHDGADGGGEPGDDSSGEAPPSLMMVRPPTSRGDGAPPPEEESVSARVGTNETFCFDMPEGASVAANWRLRGASDDRLRLSFADWAFPFGDVSHTNLIVFSRGVVEFPDGSSLVPFGAPLGIVPEANWRLLGDAAPSLFWWTFTPSNTLQLAWLNAFLGRETDGPVSFQVELNPNGAYAFRYDLTRLSDIGFLTNAVIAAGEGVTGLPTPHAGLSSVVVASADDRRCDEFREEFDGLLDGEAPFVFPEGSTNTVLEHVFYSGTTNGTFTLPQSTDDSAVLRVAVLGTGRGELIVGSTLIPLIGSSAQPLGPRLLSAPPASPNPLCVEVPRGVTCPVYLRGDGTLSVSFNSDDFAFGELPDLSGRHFRGWINFPYVDATVPCIHDYNARQREVSLPVGGDAEALTCTWRETPGIEVENHPPRSALLTGRFSGRTTTPVSYTLAHPRYLFGQTTYSQTARYCPPPPDGDDDEGLSGGGYGDGEDDEPQADCWCCFWGSCWEGCGCGCSCTFTGDVEPEDPPVDPEPEDYDESRTNCPHLTGVLKLRTVPAYTQPIRLTVPDGHRNCCPCPDHASNWVAVVYQSRRLKVVDAATGQDFSRSGESVDVRIAGVSPSSEIGDAEVAFAANGEVYLERGYTTLGVGIEGGYVPDVGSVDLGPIDRCNEDFGLPITVNTNVCSAVGFDLVTNVRLPGGNVHLGFADATASFKVWFYDPDRGDYVGLADSDGGGSLDISLAGWRRLVGAASDFCSPRTPVRITASGAGSATLVYRYWAVIDGKFVEDEARQAVTSFAPVVLADVNRDGAIDGDDAALQAAGTPFRFWCNDDTDKGDCIGQQTDARTNSANLKVDGKLDLVNFFPVQVDVSAFRQAWGTNASFRIRTLRSSGLWHCAVVNSLSADATDALQTEPQTVAGGAAFDTADLVDLDWTGLCLDDALRPDGTAMLAFEATRPAQGNDGPELVVSLGDQDVFCYRIPLSVTSVDEMYRYLNLRGAESNPWFVPAMPGMPPNLPDDETDGRNYVFVHGYNVNADQSRAWARAMFKRLWWAGLKSKFMAVDWFGDDSQIPVPVVGDVSPNYYINVEHAFMTAEALKNACDALPGEKVMMAHSLGNMLVSAAAKDFNLQYSKYYMLNAAVPMEAYDNDASDNLMVDGAWKDIGSRYRASCFYELFSQTPSDFRSKLSWKGRFAGIRNAVNCYSPTEDILQNPSVLKVLGMTVGETTGGIWSNQELFKGCAVWYGINSVTFAGTRIEGGWGINANHVANPLAYIPLAGFNASYFANYTRDDLITSPLFTSFNDSRMASTNAFNIVDYRLRAKMLGDAIPAESFAAGRNMIGGVSGNYNYQNEDGTPNGWPSNRDGWFHSDLKEVAFWYTYKLFEKIVKGE